MTCTNCLNFIVCNCYFPFKARACTKGDVSLCFYFITGAQRPVGGRQSNNAATDILVAYERLVSLPDLRFWARCC
jgi:hypothetical protein